MLFNDTVTLYKKTTSGWDRFVISGVQWADKYEKTNDSGRVSIARYASITFPEGKTENLPAEPGEEDAIFYGEYSFEISDVKGSRVSDYLALYPRSGRIKSINDNTNRTFNKNVKVVVA